MNQTITAMYDTEAAARTAMSQLVAAGIPEASIKLVPGAPTATTTAAYDHTRDEGGFWGSLKELFMPDEDRYAYTEGLSRGGTLLSATVDEVYVAKTYDILEEHGSVDLDEREATWRKEGWSGYAAGDTAAVAAVPSTGLAGAASAKRETDIADRESIPVVEERLNVGKRVVDSGRVRLRSYVVETPVSEQVSLRDETVHVDRRTVDRAATPADEALFAERTLEATTMREQAVVSKEARVTGEVGLRKEATERVETVSDKVRRTEVEVEDENGQVTRTGTTDRKAI